MTGDTSQSDLDTAMSCRQGAASSLRFASKPKSLKARLALRLQSEVAASLHYHHFITIGVSKSQFQYFHKALYLFYNFCQFFVFLYPPSNEKNLLMPEFALHSMQVVYR